LLGFIFDGVARHTQEGLDFVARAQEIGWREAVRERDRPFGDYGERRDDAAADDPEQARRRAASDGW
jgi:enoyl-CoA hydratase